MTAAAADGGTGPARLGPAVKLNKQARHGSLPHHRFPTPCQYLDIDRVGGRELGVQRFELVENHHAAHGSSAACPPAHGSAWRRPCLLAVAGWPLVRSMRSTLT